MTQICDFKLGPLNHVGVAVPDIEAAAQHYRDVFGVTDITKPQDLPPQGVTFAFVNLPSGQIELIQPYGENSPIEKFLKNNPKGGQHHVCYEVDDIHEAKSVMEARGMTVLNDPRIGAHGTPVIFLHPRHNQGVLIELMEKQINTDD
ncbi:methylmalonyl-CoA epimerase [Robiginitomaculum antarcticum]|uniref:methylmalonyl-CoA epimerase n=1 Tax=Robiginitomaculum antarcticum TaxID=437507 RepID=UPI0003684872|nr:methylmalonyl-CoA epimerase [Robiginitomaculum antarcticum]